MLFRALVLGVAVAALVAAPASATPSLAPLKPCYVAATPESREFVVIDGLGFTPLAGLDVYVDDILQPADGTEPRRANYDTTVRSSVAAPFVEEGERMFALRVTEHDAPTNSATQTAKVTRLSVEQSPDRAATNERVRFRGRGFMLDAPIYAHYVFAGKSRRTVRIGMPRGDCGRFSVKRKQFPFKGSPRVGSWTIWFDQEAHYNPRAAVRVPLTIRVRSQIKPRRAR
jgi:hypothetical protein